VAKPRKAVCLV